MKRKRLTGWLLFGAQLFVANLAFAQSVPVLKLDDERASITLERGQHEANFAQTEKDCYQRFAVSDCLRQARRQRRVEMDALRHRELVLNDADRAAKASDALGRIQDKALLQQSTPSGLPAQAAPASK